MKKSPGFKECMKLIRKHDPQRAEEGFGLLRDHANEYLDELLAEFHKETDYGLCFWLFELIAEARDPKALPLLVESLRGDDDHYWTYAVYGLRKLDTKEARKLLWEAKSYTKSTEEKTHYFQQLLQDRNLD